MRELWVIVFAFGSAVAQAQFAPRNDTPVTGGDPTGLAVADFDADGVVEVVAAIMAPDRIELFENAGAGALTSAGTVAAPAGATSGGGLTGGYATTADVDQDGDLDVVVGYGGADGPGGDGVAVFLNTSPAGGPISFAANAFYASSNTDPTHLAAADFDGDGFPDLVMGAYDFAAGTEASILMNTGTGVSPFFGAGTDLLFPGGGVTSWMVEVADFDGDTDVDIVVTGLDGTFVNPSGIAVYANNGAGVFTPTAASPVAANGGLGFVIGSAVGNFSGSGPGVAVAGILASDFMMRGDFYTNAGGLAFSPSAGGPFGLSTVPGDFRSNGAAADFNADGAADFVASNPGVGNSIHVWLGNGTAFPVVVNVATPSGTSSVVDVRARDMNGDGRMDLVTADLAVGQVSVYVNSGAFPAVPGSGGKRGKKKAASGWLPCAAGADGGAGAALGASLLLTLVAGYFVSKSNV